MLFSLWFKGGWLRTNAGEIGQHFHIRSSRPKLFWKYAANLQENTKLQSNYIEIALRYHGMSRVKKHLLGKRSIQKRSFCSSRIHKNMSRFHNKDIEILVNFIALTKNDWTCLFIWFWRSRKQPSGAVLEKRFVKVFAEFTSEAAPGGVLLKQVFLKVSQTHRKTPVPESIF